MLTFPRRLCAGIRKADSVCDGLGALEQHGLGMFNVSSNARVPYHSALTTSDVREPCQQKKVHSGPPLWYITRLSSSSGPLSTRPLQMLPVTVFLAALVPTAMAESKIISKEQLLQHAKKEDLWVLVNGKGMFADTAPCSF